MDQFYQNLRVPARRQHLHHFMGWVHQRSFQLTGTADPLKALARELSEEVRVLCFDELFVNDIGDAIILGRLFRVMFEQGMVMVCTSNQPPDQLYADGFNRDRFVPAIEAIKQHMQVIAVEGSEDHRLHPGTALQRYWVTDAAHPDALGDVVQGVDRRPDSVQRAGHGWLPLRQCRSSQCQRAVVSLYRPVRAAFFGDGLHGAARHLQRYPVE